MYDPDAFPFAVALCFKWSFLLVPIIILGWIFCVFGWIVAGVWFSVYQ